MLLFRLPSITPVPIADGGSFPQSNMKPAHNLQFTLMLTLSLLVPSAMLLAQGNNRPFSRSGSPTPARDGVTILKDGAAIQEEGNRVEMGDDGITKIDTQNPDFDLGMELLFADHMPEAIKYLGRSLRDDPTNPQAHLNRAEAFYHLDDYQNEIEECNKAIELSKAGWIYQTRHSVKAESDSDPLISKDLASAYAKRGIAKWNLKDKSSAVADFDEAIRLGEKDNSTVYVYRGQYYLNEGSLDDAFQDFTAAIAADPKVAQAYGLRGLVELKQGKDALAAADFFRAGQIDPKVREQFAGYADAIRASRAKK